MCSNKQIPVEHIRLARSARKLMLKDVGMSVPNIRKMCHDCNICEFSVISFKVNGRVGAIPTYRVY